MSLYSQNILEHYKYPQNKGKMKTFDSSSENMNRSCWDSIIVYIKIWDNNLLEKIKFEWDGCAISMATASILSEELIWLEKEEILKLNIKDIEELLWTNIWANRINCALLALGAIKESLNKLKQ